MMITVVAVSQVTQPLIAVRLFTVFIALTADCRVSVEASWGGPRGSSGSRHRQPASSRTDDQDYIDYMNYYYPQQQRTARPPHHQQQHTTRTPVTPPPFRIKCYMCHYEVKHNHPMGRKGCVDPFSPEDIPIDRNCSGPCGRIYRKLTAENDFMISRACMPGCKEDVSTQCCLSDLCNGATLSASVTSTSFCLVVAIAIILCAFIHGCCCCRL